MSDKSRMVHENIQQRRQHLRHGEDLFSLRPYIELLSNAPVDRTALYAQFGYLHKLIVRGIESKPDELSWMELFRLVSGYAAQFGYATRWREILSRARTLTEHQYPEYKVFVDFYQLSMSIYLTEDVQDFDDLEAMLARIAQSGDAALYAEAVAQLVTLYIELGQVQRAENVLVSALDSVLFQDNAAKHQFVIRLVQVEVLRRSGRATEASQLIESLSQEQESIAALDPNWQAELFMILGLNRAWTENRPLEGIPYVIQAFDIYRQTNNRVAFLGAEADLGLMYWLYGDLRQAKVHLQHVYETAVEEDGIANLVRFYNAYALCLLRRGEFHECLQILGRSQILAESIQYDVGLAVVLGYRTMAYAYLGRIDDAVAEIEQMKPVASSANFNRAMELQRARLLNLRHQRESALVILTQGVRWAEEQQSSSFKLLYLRALAECQPPDEAYFTLQQAYAIAQDYGLPYALAACELALSQVATDQSERQHWLSLGLQRLTECDGLAWQENAHPDFKYFLLAF